MNQNQENNNFNLNTGNQQPINGNAYFNQQPVNNNNVELNQQQTNYQFTQQQNQTAPINVPLQSEQQLQNNIPTQSQGFVNNNMNSNFSNVNSFNQNQSSIKIEKKKNSKLIIIIVSLIICISALLCVGYFLLFNNSNKPESVLKKYVNNLLDEKYADNYELLYLPEDSFVTSNDYLEFVQSDSNYKIIKDYKLNSLEKTSETEKEICYNVTFINKEKNIKSIDFKLKLGDNWGILEEKLYLIDWSIIVPKNTKIFVDEIEVPNRLKVNDGNIDLNQEKYVFPAISKIKKTFLFDNKLSQKKVEITPLMSNYNDKISIELTDQDLISNAYKYIKTTWNELYQSYLNNENVSDIFKKYFDDSLDIDTVNSYYKDGFDSLTRGTSGYKYVDFILTDVVEQGANYVVTDEIITINFGYKLNWQWSFTKSFTNDLRSMTRYSKIQLKIDGDSFKIYRIPDERLFSYCNDFTSDF